MKVIIAGSRHIKNPLYVDIAIQESGFRIDEVVCGLAAGVDTLGKDWAIDRNIPIRCFRANWTKYGKAAGPIRNREMAQYADALILIWDGKSKGSKSMLEIAKERGFVEGVNLCQFITSEVKV